MDKVGGIFRSKISAWNGALFLAVALLIVGWLFSTPAGLLGKADAIGYAVCHRIDLRSFHLGMRQLPLCARCSGMYLGAMLGLGYQFVLGRRRIKMPPWRVILVLSCFVFAFGLDGFNSFLHLFPGFKTLYQPANWLRLLTGTGMGLVIAAALFPAFNQTVWVDGIDQPALPGLASLLILVLLGLAMDLLVLTQNPLILYPAALISAAGVLLLLTIVYSMAWLMIFKLENRFLSLRHALTPLVGSFGIALLQLALMDAARFALTGTWDGFHLGG